MKRGQCSAGIPLCVYCCGGTHGCTAFILSVEPMEMIRGKPRGQFGVDWDECTRISSLETLPDAATRALAWEGERE